MISNRTALFPATFIGGCEKVPMELISTETLGDHLKTGHT